MDISFYHEAQRGRDENTGVTARPFVILFHGITGTPDEVLPLGELLFKSGYDVFIPLLAGHEKSIEVLRVTKEQAWIEDVARSIRAAEARHPSQLFVVGLSFGALLSLQLTMNTSIPVSGLALLSTPFVLRSAWRERALRLLSFVPDFFLDRLGLVKKTARDPAIFSQPRKGYSFHSIGALARAKSIQRKLTPRLGELRCPVLLVQDTHDHLVSPKSPATLQHFLKHSDIQSLWMDGGEHELPIGPRGEEVQHAVLRFFSQISRSEDADAA